MGETDPGDTVRVKADFCCHAVLTFRLEKGVFWWSDSSADLLGESGLQIEYRHI